MRYNFQAFGRGKLSERGKYIHIVVLTFYLIGK